MTFSPFFKLILIKIFLNLFVAFCLTLMFILFLNTFKNKKTNIEIFKIKNFYISFFVVFFYVFFFVICLILYRFSYSNNYFDINLYIKFFKNFYTKTFFLDSIFISYFVIMFFFIILLLYSKLNSFFIKHCLILYLIIFHHFEKEFNYMVYKFSLIQLKKNIIYIYLKYINKVNNHFYDIIEFILKKLPFYLLILCIIYDLYFNHMLLRITGNFLPFYLLHVIWLKISIFLEYTHRYLNQIIYNIYYKGNSVVYVNMGESKEQIIKDYVTNRLQINPVLLEDYFVLDIETNNVYKSSDGCYYENAQGNYFFEVFELQRVNINTEFTPVMLLLLYFFYLLFCIFFYCFISFKILCFII